MAARDDISSSSSEVKKDSEESLHIGTLLKEAPRKGLVQLKNSFRSLSASPKRLAHVDKDKNDPTRFLGDGMQYKAKLIGVLEVSDARGDRMCQEALGDLKMAIRAAGEHKQRIVISIGINGVRLLDEKNGDCLYHHPVHKISFIALDPTDPRAFGYIFGCPDSGHRFFGIKTEKAAQVVSNAMRELFDVFLDLRKTQDFESELHRNDLSSLSGPSLGISPSSEYMTLNRRTIREEPCSSTLEPPRQMKPFVDLLDLEVELNSLVNKAEPKQHLSSSHQTHQQQPARSVSNIDDPFGDSFSPSPTVPPASFQQSIGGSGGPPASIGKLPPPPSSKEFSCMRNDSGKEEEHWFDRETKSVFENEPFNEPAQDASKSNKYARTDNLFDVFTELDPLGTGRVKPYVDKKDFFSDLKKPPKQVLNDLVSKDYTELDNEHRNSRGSISFDPVDPFSKIDPFETEPTLTMGSFDDTFDTTFADFSSFDRPVRTSQPPIFGSNMGPLQVTLPPENRTPSGSPSMSKNRKFRTNRSSGSSCASVKIGSPKLRSRSHHTSDESRQSPVMEGVYLRNRNLETPSPTSAPEPPPRPAVSCYSIKPPPLPPKKQSPSVMPRPTSRHTDYDFIQNYESSSSMANEGPPLPVPVRKPKLSADFDAGYVPQRPKKCSVASSIETEYYLVPNNFTTTNLVNKTSLDMTLSQLTKTGFSELATALNMSPTVLSKLTIGELTEYIASLSKEEQRSTCDAIKDDEVRRKSNAFGDDSGAFEADFEGKFSNEPSLYDKYAVFRELVQEKPIETVERFQADNNYVNSSVNSDDFHELPNYNAPGIPKQSSIVTSDQSEDRYAALRDICLEDPGEAASDNEECKRDGYRTLDDETSYMQLSNVKFKSEDKGSDRDDSPLDDIELEQTEKTTYIKFSTFNGDEQTTVSDKEDDSVAEELRVKEEDEEGRDLLDVSRPQSYSESTESPTTIFKEPQCIIESTIVEEDDMENISPLENDKDKLGIETQKDTSWACFDEAPNSATVQTPNVEPLNLDAPKLAVKETSTSPWSAAEDVASPNNELYKSPSYSKPNKPKKSRSHDVKWTESEKDFERKKDHPRKRHEKWDWDENGHSWSDDENDEDDETDYVPQYSRERKYFENKRDRRRKVAPAPWPKSSRDPSPWQETEPELPDWESSGKFKSKSRGTTSSLDEERKSDMRKKGNSPWSIDTSWEEKERYQRKRVTEERRRRHREDPDYRREKRNERGDWKPSRYHKESSPWDDEYLESDDMSPRPRNTSWKQSKKYDDYSPYNDSEEEMYTKKHFVNRNVPYPAYPESEDKKERYSKKHYKHEDERPRRRRFSQEESEDRGDEVYRRKPVYSGDGSEEEKPYRRKPYSHDELSGSDMDQHYSRRSQTLHFRKPTRQRKSSKSSPFEDDFIPSPPVSHFDFPEVVKPTNKKSGSSSQPSPDVKSRSCDPKCCLRSPDVIIRCDNPTRATNSPSDAAALNFKRASPFEDDFTPVDNRRASGRSGTSSYSENESVFLSVEHKQQSFVEDGVENQMKKSESINIFKQEDDPFEDDEFFQKGNGGDSGGGVQKDIGEDDNLHKWKKAFDSFNFEKESTRTGPK